MKDRLKHNLYRCSYSCNDVYLPYKELNLPCPTLFSSEKSSVATLMVPKSNYKDSADLLSSVSPPPDEQYNKKTI